MRHCGSVLLVFEGRPHDIAVPLVSASPILLSSLSDSGSFAEADIRMEWPILPVEIDARALGHVEQHTMGSDDLFSIQLFPFFQGYTRPGHQHQEKHNTIHGGNAWASALYLTELCKAQARSPLGELRGIPEGSLCTGNPWGRKCLEKVNDEEGGALQLCLCLRMPTCDLLLMLPDCHDMQEDKSRASLLILLL